MPLHYFTCLLHYFACLFLSLLSHGLSTFNHILCNHKRAFLTCCLDDPIYLHGISYSAISYDLDKFLLLTLQFHLALVAGSYRSMNTTFQRKRSNEQAPVAIRATELPPIHILATTIYKNISNMNVQSSPGFDPFSTSFIKHAEKTIQDDRGKRHTENVPLPLLTCSICFCQTVSPHIFGTKLKSRLYTRKVQLRPPKLSSAGYQWLYLQTFCKRGQGLIDGLGSC